MEHSEGRPGYGYYLAQNILLDFLCEWDLGIDLRPSLSQAHHIWKSVKWINYSLVSVIIRITGHVSHLMKTMLLG